MNHGLGFLLFSKDMFYENKYGWRIGKNKIRDQEGQLCFFLFFFFFRLLFCLNKVFFMGLILLTSFFLKMGNIIS